MKSLALLGTVAGRVVFLAAYVSGVGVLFGLGCYTALRTVAFLTEVGR